MTGSSGQRQGWGGGAALPFCMKLAFPTFPIRLILSFSSSPSKPGVPALLLLLTEALLQTRGVTEPLSPAFSRKATGREGAGPGRERATPHGKGIPTPFHLLILPGRNQPWEM